MRLTAREALKYERIAAGRCPIHVRYNPACSICVRMQLNRNGEASPDAVEIEKPLQEQIEAECRNRMWPFVRCRMDKGTTFTFPGVPDFVIAADNGRVFWVETKSKTGKQTPEQIGFQMMLNRCGHAYHLVRSISQFLEIIKTDDQS